MRTGTIYGLLCPIEKRIVYVGQTATSLHKRLATHRSMSKSSMRDSKCIGWLKSLQIKGLIDELMIVSLHGDLKLDQLTQYENMWIALMSEKGELYNTERINNPSRPITGETGIRSYKQRIDDDVIEIIRNVVSTDGLSSYSQSANISTYNLSIAIHEGLATRASLKKILSHPKVCSLVDFTTLLRRHNPVKRISPDKLEGIRLFFKPYGRQLQFSKQFNIEYKYVRRMLDRGLATLEMLSLVECSMIENKPIVHGKKTK